MSRNIINKYVWILETVERYGSITRDQLNKLWQESPISDGEPLARRTFYNYRMGIEEIFGITIGYNSSTYEYFVENSNNTGELAGWIINSMSINGMLSDAGDIADRVMFEEVPSAREYLATVIEAIKTSRKLKFSYSPYYRSMLTEGIVLEPYFLRIFKQRWYVIGYNGKDRKVKTYSLDRLSNCVLTEQTFQMPEISAKEFFQNYFGIMTTKSSAKRVVIRVDNEQAKYLRALPLHNSQSESLGNGYSDFAYNVCLTFDFVQELMSLGHKVTVISPVELRTMIIDELKKTLANYNL